MARFIVLEGIDGSGKSSIADLLYGNFSDVYLTSEPSDSKIGRMAEEIAHEDTSPFLDTFIYLADRVDHTEEIEEKLEEGKTVVCDRYWGSTAAYQAATGDIPLDYLIDIQKPFIKEPDLTILFDIDPTISLERIQRREIKSKYENLEYLSKVRENYLVLADRNDWETIEAESDISRVKEEVFSLIDDLFD